MYSFFEGLLNPFPKREPVTPPSTLIGFCLHYAKGSKRYIAAMGVLTAFIAIIEVALYGFAGDIVDWLGSQDKDTLFSGDSGVLLLLALAATVLLPITIFFQSAFMHQTLLGNLPMIIRWMSHRLLLKQSLSYYQNELAGRLATKVMQTALAVRDTIMKMLDVILYVAVYFISALVLVFSLNWRFAAVLLAWAFGYFVILRLFLPKLMAISQKQADARSIMTGRLVDTYTNMSTVKLFSHANRESEYALDGMQSFLKTVHPQMRLVTSLTTAVWTWSALLIFCTWTMGLWLWSKDSVTAGAFAAASALVLRLNGMSHWIMWEIASLFENMGTVRDGMSMLCQARSVQDSPEAKPFEFKQGAIQFQNVGFHYGKGSGVIDEFSLDIKPGEKIGLVGRSGAGKSTLVNLLLRFYDSETGTILVDEQDVTHVTQDSLRSHIGMVTQDTNLLHRSIRDNLVYGRPGATEEELMHATKSASAHEFIMELTDAKGRKGYDAFVGERGVKLSGGQRQRIAIARTLLKNAPILILDEATSALDSEVESAIQQNLNELMQGKTVIAIAHRLSTIAELDRLIVIDKGAVVEQGTHQELIDQNGIYAQLWARQSGGFLAETVE